MNKEEQLAREMAERCAESIANQSLRQWGVLPPNPIEELSFIILRELNLVAMLKDKARLDWLSKQKCVQLDNARKRSQWCCYPAATNYEYSLWPDCRTAITNAMKQEDK